MASRKKRRITAEDLYRFESLTDMHLSPDGAHVVYSIQTVERKTEKKYSHLWIVPTQGGKPKQFTRGKQNDGHPRWSPGGDAIAFISKRGEESQAQIYVIPFGGGEARKLTDLKGDFGDFEWSPDGKQLVCVFRKKDREEIEREEDEQKKKLGVVARHITRVFYRLDGAGFLPNERWHLWTINTRTGRAKQLTKSETHHDYAPSWSPDSKHIVFLSNRSPDPDFDPDAIDLYTVPARGGALRKVDTPYGSKSSPRFSPDGQHIAYFGVEGAEGWKNESLWVVSTQGGAARNLTQPYDIHTHNWTISDIGNPAMMPPRWSRDGQRINFQISKHGCALLCSIGVDGKDMRTLIDGKGVVGWYFFNADETTLTYYYGTLRDPGQVYVRDVAGGDTRQLTHLNENWLNTIDLGSVEEVWFKSADKKTDLQGWIVKPPGFRASKKYPSILEIHGGPKLQYGELFLIEFYYLAAQGYVVFFTNPRGGRGYGEEHSKAIWNDWGGPDYEDLMVWADQLARHSYIDKKRMGVTGGSYGGYMTNWIIGHTDRFAAAVTQRSISNLISMWGSSDFNWAFQQEFGNTTPFEDVENYWRQSPLKYAANIKTPTLVIHSEQDLRCNIEQGEQMFVALKKLGVDTEMVRFPNEPHGLSRSGRTDRRIVRLNHILRWFDKYLK